MWVYESTILPFLTPPWAPSLTCPFTNYSPSEVCTYLDRTTLSHTPSTTDHAHTSSTNHRMRSRGSYLTLWPWKLTALTPFATVAPVVEIALAAQDLTA